MDERLRRLQREAIASGDPDAIIKYRREVARSTQFGVDYRVDESKPPTRQKIIDLLIFYGIKHIIIDRNRDCAWNGHIVVMAPCRLSRLFVVVSEALSGSQVPSWHKRILGEDYSTETAIYVLLIDHYYHNGRLRTASSKTWFSGEINLLASMQMIMLMDEMEIKGLFIGPLNSSYHAVRKKFVKWIINNIDEGMDEIIEHYQEQLTIHPNSVRLKASLFFWELFNEYEWGIDDLLEIYNQYLATTETSSPRQFKRASRKLLNDYGML